MQHTKSLDKLRKLGFWKHRSALFVKNESQKFNSTPWPISTSKSAASEQHKIVLISGGGWLQKSIVFLLLKTAHLMQLYINCNKTNV